MPSMMAIVSKAVFEKAARGKSVGDIWPTDRYVSQKLTALVGDLYLVTVRPGEALWLVGVLVQPAFDGAQWTAAPNAQPIRDISALKPRLVFANGQGLPTKPGTLGMSLQTARVLTDADVALLAGGAKPAATSGAGAKSGARSGAASSTKSGATSGAKSGTTSGAKPAATSNPKSGVKSATTSSTKSGATSGAKPAAKSVAAKSATTSGAKPAATSVAAKSATTSRATSVAAKSASTSGATSVAAKGLAGAHAALAAGDNARALALLVEAWADAPHPRLAELVRALSVEARTAAPPNLRGKTAAARAAWDAHAATARAADIPMLLESLCDVASGDAVERLETVADWMPDPRVDAWFVDVLREAPYRATSTKPFWTKLFALAAEIGDPAQRARIAALTFDGVAVTMREWLRGKAAKLVAGLGEETAPAAPHLDELAALVSGRRVAGAAARADIDALYRAVYEAPEEDGPRVVLADALIEREDPRGELITVQLGLVRDPEDRGLKARERELLAAHGKSWLGELEPILMADVRFERGFLAACKIDNSKLDRVRALVGHPAWSTVRDLEGSALIALDPVMRSLRRLVFRQRNARRHEGLPGAWRDLLVDTERGIEELQYESLHSERQWLDTVEGRRQVQISEHAEVDALCACTALPQLRRLALRDNPILYVGRLAQAPVLERLEWLGFLYDRNNRFDEQRASPLVDFAKLLAAARVPVLHFEIGSFHETTLELERGAKGYEQARMTLGPTIKSNWSHQLVDEAIRMLDSLPRTVRALRVTTRKWTEPQQVARLRAAATQLQLDVEVS